MKISSIHLENFKQFNNLDIEVRNLVTGNIAKRFLLLGDNGTGKTTVLQGVALTLSMACYTTPGDEIELNLHPPLAQSFLSHLPEIGPNCQFLYTTHSEVIRSISNPNQIYSLAGGKLCL